jgi:ubiquinone/menaquinone biosynthesis C-methylase UbiE
MELAARRAYEQGELYAPGRICAKPVDDPRAWADRLLVDKLALVRKYYTSGPVLDLCCAAGEHLLALAPTIESGVGLDFSQRYIDVATAMAREREARNVSFVHGDAKDTPFPQETFSLIYCFSSLYAIPKVEDVVKEITRVLRPGGIAVLDFGNRLSLNTYCLRYYTDWPQTHPITVPEMNAMLRSNALESMEHRSYQILPLWAGLPRHLWPLLHPAWQEIMRRRVAGRMLDEWVSSLPGMRNFAFRQVIVCRKAANTSVQHPNRKK